MNPNLFIGVPVYGGLDPLFAQALIHYLKTPICPTTLRFNAGDSLVCRARNVLTAEFLKSKCTHLLFIDSDLIFSGAHIERLLSHNVPLVAGFYPKKQDGELAWVCNAHPDHATADATGLQPVRYIGTGFMLIERSVLEAMVEQYDLGYTPDHKPTDMEWDFWSAGVYKYPDHTRRYLSEDWLFCQRWLDLGGTVWGDTRVILKHCGHAVYPLASQMPELLGQSVQKRPEPEAVPAA